MQLLRRRAARAIVILAGGVALSVGGCARGPRYVPADERVPIDRVEVEYPNDLQFTPFIDGLTAPVAIAFENDEPRYKGSTLIAESGNGGFLDAPRILGFLPSGEAFPVYPRFTRIPILDEQFRLRGPIYAMALARGKIFVAHRDDRGYGIITALDYDGGHSTVVADLPTLGDYGITDLAVHPTDGRLYFGIGAATNSGVVGMDNFQSGWVKRHLAFADQSLVDLKLTGFRFETEDPTSGLFGDNTAVTGPFQGFNSLGRLKIPASPVGKPTSAVYSVNLEGGDLRVEAHGIRLPRGLVFTEYGNLFVTNNGMETRGTRPIKNDPDAVLRVPRGGQLWYGFPDYSSDLHSIEDPKFQPPEEMIRSTGYPQVANVIDREASGLTPLDRTSYVRGVFPPMSGAAKMAFVPDYPIEPFKPFRGQLIVAMFGDRAPFGSGGEPSDGLHGYRVKVVDLESPGLETRRTGDFIVNTQRLPASRIRGAGREMERPIDVKFGPDGALYVLDYGRMEMVKGHEKVAGKTGRVYRLGPPATQPAAAAAGTQPARATSFQD